MGVFSRTDFYIIFQRQMLKTKELSGLFVLDLLFYTKELKQENIFSSFSEI